MEALEEEFINTKGEMGGERSDCRQHFYCTVCEKGSVEDTRPVREILGAFVVKVNNDILYIRCFAFDLCFYFS